MSAIAPTTSCSFISGVSTVVSDGNGLRKLSDCVLSIFDVIAHFYASFRDSVSGLTLMLRQYVDISYTIISISRRIRAWACGDEEGKMPWETAWQDLPSLATLTVSTALDFLLLLEGFKVIALGAALVPITHLSTLCTTLSYSLDAWLYSDIASLKGKDASRTLKHQTRWTEWKEKISAQAVLPKEWHDHVQHKIDYWSAKNCDEKKRHWETLQTQDRKAMLETCDAKIEKLSKENRTATIDKTKNWIYVASYVSSVVLILLSYIQPFLTGAALAALLIAYSGNYLLDFVSYLLDTFWE